MKSIIIRFFTIGCLISLSLFFQDEQIFAQENGKEMPETAETEEAIKEKKYIDTLNGIVQSSENIKKQIKEKEKEFRSATLPDDKERITQEISMLNENLSVLGESFDKIAVGIDLQAFDEKTKEEFQWEKEVQELLHPFIQEVKTITSRPRQIEKLRNEVTYYGERLPISKKALENIELLISQTEEKKLKNRLLNLKKDWESRIQQIANQLAVANLQLEELTRQKLSFLESARIILKKFFKSRGNNLLLSLLAFLSMLLFLQLLYRVIAKYSPIHKKKERPFYVRVFNVLYHLLTLVGAVLALLTVLYICGDWVLLTVALIFILGVIWTTKESIPRFWEQIKILLNLGTVRENERVIYMGVPWKVTSLNLYTKLENPILKSKIRVPLQKLTDLESYPYQKGDPWFPCQGGDWVILADETRGKVINQTHEMVQLVLRGGAHKTYLTEEFLRMNPMNLSTNFRLRITFGIDYKHQKICTHEVPEKMKEIIHERLIAEGYEDDLIFLNVEFESAGASSLDMVIIADFSGKVADLYNRLSRLLQRLGVEACNLYGWEIPFTQLTIHHADEK